MKTIQLSKPLKASIELTYSCPFKCIFCEPNIASKEKFLCSRNTTSLNKTAIEKVIKKLADGGIIRVFLSGGEPLLRRDLPHIIKLCYDFGIVPCISTNGILATKKTVTKIKNAGLDDVQVSIQSSNPNINDNITGFKDSFNKAFAGVTNFIKAGIRVDVSSVGTKLNVETITDLAKKCSKNGVSMFRLLRLMAYTQKTFDLLFDKQTLLKVSEEFYAAQAAGEFGEMRAILQASPMPPDFTVPEIIYPIATTCYAGKVKMDIFPDGTVAPCRSLRDFSAGNILKEDVDTIWNSGVMMHFRELTPDKYIGKCGECEYKWFCYSCRAIAVHLDNSIYGDDLTCFKLRDNYANKNKESKKYQ